MPKAPSKPRSQVPAALTALDYLARPGEIPPRPVCVLFGDEPFLKSEALAVLRGAVVGGEGGEFSSRTLDGSQCEPREVFDELATVALFGGGQRFVAIAEADEFVSRHRSLLEDYLARPQPTGVLVLEVKSWPSNTKLYKLVAESGLPIDCKPPDDEAILHWLRSRAEATYRASFAKGAAERLLAIVGPQMGRLDQEVAKLSLLAAAPAPGKITVELIDDAVGDWRAKTAWEMIDAAAAGDAREALVQLDRLLMAGEQPVALLAQIAGTLRRLAAAARIMTQAHAGGQRLELRDALQQAGVKTWPAAMNKAESQMRQLGARRAGKLYGWLLEADLALKGSSSSGDRARLVIEQLIVRMSRQLAPPQPVRN